MTNGEKFCIDFPNIRIDVFVSYVQVVGENYEFNNLYPLTWWNAEYKEPTTKNDVPDNNVGSIYTCSCGYGWDKTKVVRHHFCPNCGKAVEPTKNNLVVDAVSRQAINEYIDFILTHGMGKKKSFDFIKKFAANMPAVTPQESRWIPISERLPEERLGVLVWCPTRKNIYCACYEEKQWWIFGAYWEKVTEEIIAWRPLPTKPYSEVEK
jgi:hypothetical protein